ncbi:MAG: hypothetical protein ACTHQQ_06445 [Solirubrobacteraceae bacterium]
MACLVAAVCATLGVATAAANTTASQVRADWTQWAFNAQHTGYNPHVTGLGRSAAAGLNPAFATAARAFTAGGNVKPSPNAGGSGSDNVLSGVAATSATNAWAVGFNFTGALVPRTLVVHWNGKAWKVQPSPNPGGANGSGLNGVAATSATNAWAVGDDFKGGPQQTLVEHWNGKAWKVVPSPNPLGSGNNVLSGVAAISATNAWAVGYYFNGNALQTLVEHWNGKAWKVVPSPNPGGSGKDNVLSGVAATSATDVWAVGDEGSAARTLVEHWDGKAWKVVPSPNPGGSGNDNLLLGVAATSATNGWAVGYYFNGNALRTLVERWNGKVWKVVPSPNPGGSGNDNFLDGVAATSATNAWAVGFYANVPGGAGRSVVERWNGKAWKVVPSPNPGGSTDTELNGLAAISATNAWAVGYFTVSARQTLVERWNGRAWKVQPSPNVGGSDNNVLSGVAATSATNAWAVGDHSKGAGGPDRTLIEHWNGKAWQVQTSPGLVGDLSGVAAVSASDAWAVGDYSGGTLVEHWNGKAWKVVPSPNPGGSGNNVLSGVAAISATNAWAVGYYGSAPLTLILHWDGKAWKVKPSANPGAGNGTGLSGVAATSATNAWAVGLYANVTDSAFQTMTEQWNGKAWRVKPSPNPGGSGNNNGLSGVAATSSTNAWAVGFYANGTADQTLAEQWNGKAWKVKPSPNPAGSLWDNGLSGVAATSATNAWAVGFYSKGGGPDRTLVLHWDGKAWKVQPSPNPAGASKSTSSST